MIHSDYWPVLQIIIVDLIAYKLPHQHIHMEKALPDRTNISMRSSSFCSIFSMCIKHLDLQSTDRLTVLQFMHIMYHEIHLVTLNIAL